MQINLRKARKLEQKIQSQVEAMPNETVVQVRALGSSEERDHKVAIARVELLNQKKLREDLLSARFMIRRLIAAANGKAGMNDLMNRREEIAALLKLSLSTAQTFDASVMSDEAEARRLQIAKGDSGYLSGVFVSAPVAHKEDIEQFKAESSRLKRELEELEDELSQKNLGVKISLPSEAVSLLKSQDLI